MLDAEADLNATATPGASPGKLWILIHGSSMDVVTMPWFMFVKIGCYCCMLYRLDVLLQGLG